MGLAIPAPVAASTLAPVVGHTPARVAVHTLGRAAVHTPVPVAAHTLAPVAAHTLALAVGSIQVQTAEPIRALVVGLTLAPEGLVTLAPEASILINGIAHLPTASEIRNTQLLGIAPFQ